ncbi:MULTISPECIES: DUF3800 domain-containing protein [Enterobacter]|uniref:DUF3800 domain-containing protein n=1 Tax=Enterobacter TaxID=547 RepID=UPI000C78D291|nr:MULTISPECIES: DUF3800 domain-containing protein [Enterobacter]AUM05053.1 DUF3800 domain-containing protein [Enterobacter sp. Crenshaw]UVH62613.1 DUF3800 domain-containing protein [Enterobacter sp. Crenshaw]WBN01245.1 DUF3800 domain-containing protein [Enterobacter asburiae]
MHFYVDETGQTGRNLFDKTQPVLSYGVLSSDANLDKVAEADLAVLRKTLGVERLHAAELGLHRLSDLVDTLLVLQKKHRIRFDIWQVVKRDHAIISFFDQVFDQGMNPAVPWSAYWTPLRYPLLLNLSNLFDDELAEKAWRARLEAHDERSSSLFSEVCGELLQRVHILSDARSVELITDALSWAMVNFDELGYNCKTNKEKLQIMPNMIGFQSVLHGICSRLGAPNRKADIIVDQQSQFNTTQRELNEFYYQIREQPWALGPGLPVMDMKNMPAKPLVFQSGTMSAGLELVDIYLWIFKRYMEQKELTRPLSRLIYTNLKTARTDSVSLQSVAKRFKEFFEKLPEPTAEMMEKANELRAVEETRRLAHRVQSLSQS